MFLPGVNTEIMNVYLQSLSENYPNKQILLIVDQAGWHKAKKLAIPPNITLKYLPPYSPELNPVEKLWQWLKKHVCRNRLFTSENDLMDALTKALLALSPPHLAALCHCSYLLH